MAQRIFIRSNAVYTIVYTLVYTFHYSLSPTLIPNLYSLLIVHSVLNPKINVLKGLVPYLFQYPR